MLFFLLFFIFLIVFVSSFVIFPAIYGASSLAADKRQQQLISNMERIMPSQQAKKVSRMFVFAPLILAIGIYLFFPPGELQIFGAIIGLTMGFLLPGVYVKLAMQRTKDKFTDQLIDALLIMSSSFRGGLSLVQALEAVVDEMPDPIRMEFATVLGENKMGVSLEEALNHLFNRMPSIALQQMITAILLARETGGNLPTIFGRIVTNIRENKKIQQNLNTLTIQGKIQGIVMALLPVGFAFIVYNANRTIFTHMLESDMGKGLLLYCLISELIGGFLIIKISTFKDY